MALEDTTLAVRKVRSVDFEQASYAGFSCDTGRGRVTALLCADDPAVSIVMSEKQNALGGLLMQLAIVYIGAFLDQVVCVGKSDYQIFRLHVMTQDKPIVPEVRDVFVFGDEIGRDENDFRLKIVSLENLCGPRYENSSLLVDYALGRAFESDVFCESPVTVRPPVSEFVKNMPAMTHPGMVSSHDEPEVWEMVRQLERWQDRSRARIH